MKNLLEYLALAYIGTILGFLISLTHNHNQTVYQDQLTLKLPQLEAVQNSILLKLDELPKILADQTQTLIDSKRKRTMLATGYYFNNGAKTAIGTIPKSGWTVGVTKDNIDCLGKRFYAIRKSDGLSMGVFRFEDRVAPKSSDGRELTNVADFFQRSQEAADNYQNYEIEVVLLD